MTSLLPLFLVLLFLLDAVLLPFVSLHGGPDRLLPLLQCERDRDRGMGRDRLLLLLLHPYHSNFLFRPPLPATAGPRSLAQKTFSAFI